jgi:outer membrane protein assembly factor BamB
VTITPPLVRIWTQRFDAAVSYPIMADSRVFVALSSAVGRPDAAVKALDAASGAVLWTSQPLRGFVPFSALTLAYDRGVLFAADEGGDVLAFEPETGSVRWRTTLGPAMHSGGLPLAAGGAVMFVGASGMDEYALSVIDERDGSLVYTVPLPAGGDPTLGGGRLYVTGDCDDTVAVDAATGHVAWRTQGACSPVAGRRGSMLHDGVLWLPPSENGVRALDPASGRSRGALDDPSPTFMPSAAEDQLVLPALVPENAFRVFGATGGAFRFQVALPAPPVLPALTTPDTVYVLAGKDDKFLYALDLVRRQFSWQSSEPAAPAEAPSDDERRLAQGLAASAGRIVVAYGHSLSAFAAAH